MGWGAVSRQPRLEKLHGYGKAELTAEEQAFIDNQVETLLAMVDDFKIVNETKDLPEPVWDYLKKEGFFSLIIPKSYGGREFSAIANSTIVTRIATKSLSVAVTVMVPNSLGPGELLMHYGTQAQKDFWLPGLANGKEVPCFALTGPEAGSDAGAIPDKGIVCKGMHKGEEVLGIRLNWNKRYITLAPAPPCSAWRSNSMTRKNCWVTRKSWASPARSSPPATPACASAIATTPWGWRS